MRIAFYGTWRGHPATVAWEDGRVTTDPPELYPLFELHASLRAEGIGAPTSTSQGSGRGLEDPLGVLDLASTLFDRIDEITDELGRLSVEDRAHLVNRTVSDP